MKLRHCSSIVLSVGLAMAMGCAAEVSSEQAGQADAKQAELNSKAEAALRQYVDSLVKREEASLKAVVSSEILDRAATYKGLPAFLEKQRNSMVKQFGEDPNLASRVSVGRAVLEGNVVTADIGVDGRAVQKQWYFVVADDGNLKLNILPPGFSRPRPPGSTASSSYLVQTASAGTVQYCGAVWCPNGGAYAYVCYPEPTQGWADCNNTCGFFWAGSEFKYGSQSLGDCDWNTWGVDVWVDAGSAWCNDQC